MMNVIIDGEIYQRQPKGGISRIYNETLPRMCELDDNLRFKILTDGYLQQTTPVHSQIVHHSVPSYQLYLRPGRFWRPVVSELKLATRRWYTGNQAEMIWQATYYTPPKRWQGRFVVLVHDLVEERFPDLFDQPKHDVVRKNKRESVRSADVVMCNSSTTRRDVCAFYGLSEEKIRVISLAASNAFWLMTETELAASPVEHSRPFLLYIGNRSSYKNFDLLLRAYSTWHARIDIDLLVVGDKWTPTEQKKLQELGLSDAAVLREHVDDRTLRVLYNQAFAFVYPSLYEGFGIPLLEAMACGCPIVASAIPTTLEIAQDLPHYFQPTDEGSLHHALDQILNEGKQPVQIVVAQVQTSRYSWDTTARQMLDIYHELID